MVLDALTKAGAPPEVLEQVRRSAGSSGGDFEVWPDNWESVSWFCDVVGTSWRYIGGMGPVQRTGLDYTAVTALLRELVPKKRRRRELLEDLRLMERAALEVWAQAQR
ncbi:hypothetical protein GCM10025795_02320 [Verticiella sediminum]